MKRKIHLILIALLLCLASASYSQIGLAKLSYLVSFPEPKSNSYNLSINIDECEQDSIHLKLPNWMPGYYQIMNYYAGLSDLYAKDADGVDIPVRKVNENTWSIKGVKGKSFSVSYKMLTGRKFVATSYIDEDHAYLVPGNSFLYVEGSLQQPVLVKIELYPEWNDIATGLKAVAGKSDEFLAPNFDILYDCPILVGDLEELPSFDVGGIKHNFIGYELGVFDRIDFMDKLEKAVQSAVDIIGDIPYEEYTFIAIGPGFGGIEHLNNTTVSFDGNRLDSPEAMIGMISFLTHEYFHHYNVKRIRPFELGPFDYDHGSRTNLLWLSEGFTVYYESQILKNAGLIDSEEFLENYLSELNTLENDSGRFHQSLNEASFYTWEEGPFGGGSGASDQSISVYNKGTVIALLLDLEIRNATKNEKSLNDVMRRLYWQYYIQENRGFTDAELQQTCEQIAGVSLSDLFKYVYTNKEIDYSKYFGYAGLSVDRECDVITKRIQLSISRQSEPTDLQVEILRDWME